MTRWTRVPIGVTVFCGGCGAALATGAPVRVTTPPGGARPRRRCADCAGPAPPDLPAIAPPSPPLAQIARLLPFDWRARAAREPGEDDA